MYIDALFLTGAAGARSPDQLARAASDGRRCGRSGPSPRRGASGGGKRPRSPPSKGAAMAVDVQTETKIMRPVADVSAYAEDPSNAPHWYVNIESVEWKTAPPLAVGSRVAFVARFLGRRLAYTYEIVEWVRAERLVMRTAEGPFPMQTSYTWAPVDDRSTRMTLRNCGEPSGFSSLVAPVVALAMRRANRKDLARLKAVLEARS